jgi:hypothetical protein
MGKIDIGRSSRDPYAGVLQRFRGLYQPKCKHLFLFDNNQSFLIVKFDERLYTNHVLSIA